MGVIDEIRVRYLGRDWGIVRTKWPNGTAAIFLRNPRSGCVLPASIQLSVVVGGANEAHVPDEHGLLAALVDAGIVCASQIAGRWGSLTVWKCEVVHPLLVKSGHPLPLAAAAS